MNPVRILDRLEGFAGVRGPGLPDQRRRRYDDNTTAKMKSQCSHEKLGFSYRIEPILSTRPGSAIAGAGLQH